jgi:hemerythrin
MNVEWKDSYRIGNDRIDLQHQQLFEMANAFFMAEDQAALLRCAMALYHQVSAHFADEEALMREVGFPDYAEHVSTHQEILSRLDRISKYVGSLQYDKEQIRAVMIGWALDHIAYSDIKIASYIRTAVGHDEPAPVHAGNEADR